MGRPKKEKTMSAKERTAKYRSDPAKRLKENEKKKKARIAKPPLTQTELDEKREKARKRKEKSRATQNRQKLAGAKIKARNKYKKRVKTSSEEQSSSFAKNSRSHSIFQPVERNVLFLKLRIQFQNR